MSTPYATTPPHTDHHQQPQVDMVKPTAIGAFLGAFLGGFPPFCLLSFCCCLPTGIGGWLAGFLYGRSATKVGVFPSIGIGALLGAIAGCLGGFGGGLLLTLTSTIIEKVAPSDPDTFDGIEGFEWLDQVAADSAEVSPILNGIVNALMGAAIGAVLGALGGMLGIVMTRKAPPAPPMAHGQMPQSPMPPSPTPQSPKSPSSHAPQTPGYAPPPPGGTAPPPQQSAPPSPAPDLPRDSPLSGESDQSSRTQWTNPDDDPTTMP